MSWMVSSRRPPGRLSGRAEGRGDLDLDPMRKLRWLVLLGAAVLEVGCGLPDAYFLVPPTATQIGSGLLNSSFVITGTSRANDIDVIFTGYEIYYKCYGPFDSLDADKNYGSTSNTYIDLLQNGFHRVCRGPGYVVTPLSPDTYPGTATAPLVDIDRIDSGNAGNAYTVRINFADPSPPSFDFTTSPVSYFQYTPPGGPSPTKGWEIRRFVQADATLGSVCRTFASNPYYGGSIQNWTQTDTDLTPTVYNNALGTGQINVMLYAVSYGTGLDNSPRYSYPVYLGYTLLQIF